MRVCWCVCVCMYVCDIAKTIVMDCQCGVALGPKCRNSQQFNSTQKVLVQHNVLSAIVCLTDTTQHHRIDR